MEGAEQGAKGGDTAGPTDRGLEEKEWWRGEESHEPPRSEERVWNPAVSGAEDYGEQSNESVVGSDPLSGKGEGG